MLYIALMVIGLVLLFQTGALGELNECLIPALSEMWGDSWIDVLVFTMIGADDQAANVYERLTAESVLKAEKKEEEEQWFKDKMEAIAYTTPLIPMGWTIREVLAPMDNSDDLRAYAAPLLGEIEAPTGVLVSKYIPVPEQAQQAAPEKQAVPVQQTWLDSWLSGVAEMQLPEMPSMPMRRRRSKVRA